MTLRDLLEILHALTPPTALDAPVSITGGTADLDILTVYYSDGKVAICVDEALDDYEAGYQDGFQDGKEKQDDDEG